MKKKAIWLIALLCVGLGFLLWQKARLTAQLSERLAQQHIQVAQVESQLFPTQLSLHNVKFQQKARWFFFEKITFDVSLIALLSGNVQIQQIELEKGYGSDISWQEINLTVKTTALSWQDIFALSSLWQTNEVPILAKPLAFRFLLNAKNSKVQLNLQGVVGIDRQYARFTQFSGLWKFWQPLYGDVENIAFQLEQGDINLKNSPYQIDFRHLIINQTPFSQGKILLEFQPHFINGKLALAPQGNVDFQFEQQPDRVEFSAQNIAIEQWLALFKLPVLATGQAQLKGEVALVDMQIEKGQASLQIANGKVKNVNLLAIVAQRLPINYDSARLQNRDSPFEQLTAQLIWDQQKMQWQNLQLRDPYFQLAGEGTVDQVSQQCDFLVNLNLREKKYQNFRLPLHFFGDCYSPQYKIESTQGLKKQLKDLFKQRFSR
ncbi:AsmA-like C-terminal region-containing protein [Avibacterium avium]|uniref:AsmA-like C-terminal region-containing protein n=1 Tax=Avibacterium avium TaxID=751 RepID=UPI003BF77C5C